MMNTNLTTRKPMHRFLAVILSLLMVMTLGGTSVFAASKPTVEKADYEGSGRIEVEFSGKVSWKNAAVTVKDLNGKTYKATIIEKDSDEIDFRIKNYKKNKTYKITIKGVAKRGTTSYTSVTTKVKIPAAGKITIDEIDYDKTDREVEIDFVGRVQWKSPTVKITDSNGKNYVTRIIEKDSEGIEIKVNKLTTGKTYKYKITGIRKYGTKDYITLSGSFKAR